MIKKCIFDENKECTDCGKCLKCDLDNKKICDNCGKCLELQGVDIKAIRIEDLAKDVKENEVVEESLDEISEPLPFEEDLDQIEKENDSLYSDTLKISDQDEEYEDAWDHLEYIDDLQDMLDSDDIKNISEEEYPGLIRIKKRD